MHRFQAFSLISLSLLASCSLHRHEPDLPLLYNRSAQIDDIDRNPVVVIPGLLGSRLEAEDGTIVWGLLGGDYANPSTAEGARQIALPMAEGEPLDRLRDDVLATGVVDRLRVQLLGLPFEISAYLEILNSLGVGGYRDESLALSKEVDYGSTHYTCFQFAYDWRRDIVESARELHAFLAKNRAQTQAEISARYGVTNAQVRFDLVAHSMGGLVARYYLRYGTADLPEDGSLPPLTWAGAEWLQRVVLVGTPNAGSLEALHDLVLGRKFGPTIPRYEPALLGTFPGAYQLLPRGRHHPVLVDPEGEPLAEDLLDPEVWKRFHWGLADPAQDPTLQILLPEVATAEERRRIALDHLAKVLRRARQFTAALDLPASPPPGVELYLLAGDPVATPAAVAVDPQTGSYQVVRKEPGDGKVLRSSALMDERMPEAWTRRLISPIHWTGVTFLSTSHLGLTRDPAFTNNVLFLLLEKPD